jgi:hypothetical protein
MGTQNRLAELNGDLAEEKLYPEGEIRADKRSLIASISACAIVPLARASMPSICDLASCNCALTFFRLLYSPHSVRSP